MKSNRILIAIAIMSLAVLASCMGSKGASISGRGGEVTGIGGGRGFTEPTPYGMTQVPRGFLRMGIEKQDSLWGKPMPVREISVDGFWMDETEVTNSEYKQFVYWVRDSILRTRLADPAYGGDETYMITEDKNGDPVPPHLNWKKSLPRKPNEDEQRAFESLYVTNPVTGEKLLDASQLNYRYEIYDYATAALRRNRLRPDERNLNTDVTADAGEVVMISKDTAYIDDEGRIVRETIDRPLSSEWDFLNTYIVNVYPDTTCWIFQQPGIQRVSRRRRDVGAGKRVLRVAHRLSAERPGRRGALHTALPPADRGRVGVCRARKGRHGVPLGERRAGEQPWLLQRQLQARPGKLYQGRQPYNKPRRHLHRKLKRTV